MTLDLPALPAYSMLSHVAARVVACWPRSACRAILLALLIVGTLAAADEIRPAIPSLVVSASGFDRLTGDGLRLLQLAGATNRAEQLQGAIVLVGSSRGVDRDRPLGVFVYLSPEAKRDPQLVAFLPVSKMEDLQQSLASFKRITLAPLESPGWWEIRAGQTTIPIRHSDGYAFVALRKELLSDPLPSVDEWSRAHANYDLAATVQRAGIPQAVIDRALADLHEQAERDAQKLPEESDSDHEFRSRVVRSLNGLVERTLQEFDRTTVGMTVSHDTGELTVDAIISATAGSDLAGMISGLAGDSSQFNSLVGDDVPLGVTANWKLSGDGQQLATDLVARLRRDIERRMEEDGTSTGPAAEPIRQILDALAATVADGRIDGGVQFRGERPGAMLLLAEMRLSDAPQVAESLKSLLPLIGETPSIADVEMNAVRVDGIDLHRLTFEAIRRQDEWLYGPDLGLYLGSGRGALWLAVGGYDRETELQELLDEPAAADVAGTPPVLRVDLRLAPWLLAETGPNGKRAPWLDLAWNSFAEGGDQLQIELTAARNELRLRGTLEAGYIRLLGAAWRAKQRQGSDGAPPNLAAPVLP
jgi:hypothetical protein